MDKERGIAFMQEAVQLVAKHAPESQEEAVTMVSNLAIHIVTCAAAVPSEGIQLAVFNAKDGDLIILLGEQAQLTDEASENLVAKLKSVQSANTPADPTVH